MLYLFFVASLPCVVAIDGQIRHSHAPTPTAAEATQHFHDLLANAGLDEPHLDLGEVGLTAKFSEGGPDVFERFYVCTHKCAYDSDCPPMVERAAATRHLLRPLHPPPLAQLWMGMLESELQSRPGRLPQICVGASAGAGKLYVGGTHEGGAGFFPDLPLARNATVHSYCPELADRGGVPEGELISLEWSESLRRMHRHRPCLDLLLRLAPSDHR